SRAQQFRRVPAIYLERPPFAGRRAGHATARAARCAFSPLVERARRLACPRGGLAFPIDGAWPRSDDRARAVRGHRAQTVERPARGRLGRAGRARRRITYALGPGAPAATRLLAEPRRVGRRRRRAVL